MTPPTPPRAETGGGRRRRRTLVVGLLATIGIPLAIGAFVSALAPAPPGDDASGTAATVNSPIPSPVPTADLDRIHAALHDIGARCFPQPSTDPASREALDADASVIISFAAHYPDIRFSIDDESGTALSLLLATRDDLATCRPGAAAVIAAALPSPYRSTPPGTVPVTS